MKSYSIVRRKVIYKYRVSRLSFKKQLNLVDLFLYQDVALDSFLRLDLQIVIHLGVG